jgi:very-short-patch-repair endonuclease
MGKHLPEYSTTLVPVARKLRKQMTDAERKLWSQLKRNQLGVKFGRQVPFGNSVVGFYGARAKLIIELVEVNITRNWQCKRIRRQMTICAG